MRTAPAVKIYAIAVVSVTTCFAIVGHARFRTRSCASTHFLTQAARTMKFVPVTALVLCRWEVLFEDTSLLGGVHFVTDYNPLVLIWGAACAQLSTL